MSPYDSNAGMDAPPPLPSKKGMGCFAQGCLTAFIVGLFLIVVVGGGLWWAYGKAINNFTSDRPASIQIDEPDTVAFQQAEGKLNQLRRAVTNKTDATIELSAADLNALIARDPAFAGVRGKMHIDMAGDDMIFDLSVPLDMVHFPGLKGRWFNGRAGFGLGFDSGEFSFTARSLEANGHRMEEGSGVSASFLQSFSKSFTRSFNQSFQQDLQRNPIGGGFWNQIKSMSIQDGRMIVVTKAGG